MSKLLRKKNAELSVSLISLRSEYDTHSSDSAALLPSLSSRSFT